MDQESVRLVDRWRGGDELAAGEIYNRYVTRLISLAASRLSPALARRIGAEDIVQSVYRSFFARTGEDRLHVQQSGQLWGLLAAITLNKVRAQARYHQAEKRSISEEASIHASQSCYGLAPTDLAGEPTADEAAMLAEQYHVAAGQMSSMRRQVFEMYLQNLSVSDIAESVRRSERTIRRELEHIRGLLTDMLGS